MDSLCILDGGVHNFFWEVVGGDVASDSDSVSACCFDLVGHGVHFLFVDAEMDE
jgi:hypothetical protein